MIPEIEYTLNDKISAWMSDPRQEIKDDFEKAINGLIKGSKLRDHYIKLTIASNLIRAYTAIYVTPDDILAKQIKMLQFLIDIESRKSKKVYPEDIKVLREAQECLVLLLDSSDPIMVIELLEFMHSRQTESKWYTPHKSGSMKSLFGKKPPASKNPG